MRLNHECVGPEHILIGLTDNSETVEAILSSLGLDREGLRRDIESTVKPGLRVDLGDDLPYTSRAKRSLELAMNEASRLRDTYVGAEHLLLGLIKEGKGIAAQILASRGVTLDAARDTIRNLRAKGVLRAHPEGAEWVEGPASVSEYWVEVHYDDGRILRDRFADKEQAMRFLLEH